MRVMRAPAGYTAGLQGKTRQGVESSEDRHTFCISLQTVAATAADSAEADSVSEVPH